MIGLGNGTRDIVGKLIADSPKVHDWGNGLQSGGLTGEILTTISAYLLDEFGEGNFRSIETGAGLSTLLFAAARPLQHVAINPDVGLRDRIGNEAKNRQISLDQTDYLLEFSEDVLPDLAKTTKVDIALIDGGHGWPSVFVDFCYMNMMLRKGGIMIVDDIILYPCTQLYLLLKHQPGWKLERTVYSKTTFFRKETDAIRLPDFGGQPYLRNNQIIG